MSLPGDEDLLSWDVDAVPATYTALSSCRCVQATVNRNLEVVAVDIVDLADSDQLGAAIVDAVNRALLAAQHMDIDSLRESSAERVNEFNAVLDGLDATVDRSQSRVRGLRR